MNIPHYLFCGKKIEMSFCDGTTYALSQPFKQKLAVEND